MEGNANKDHENCENAHEVDHENFENAHEVVSKYQKKQKKYAPRS